MSEKKAVNSKLKLNSLSNSYNAIYFFIIPILLPLFREQFHINYVQSGLILGVHMALRSIFSLVFGYFGDQYDRRIIIAGGFIFSSFFLGGLLWVNNINTIITFLSLVAIGASVFRPLAMAVVRENSKEHQERALSRPIFSCRNSRSGYCQFIIRFFCSNVGMENNLFFTCFARLFFSLCLSKIKKR